MFSQKLDVSQFLVSPSNEEEQGQTGPKTVPVQAVLYFGHHTDHKDGIIKLMAKHGTGLNGRGGIPVFFHRDVEKPRAGINFVEMELKDRARYCFAKPIRNKKLIQEVMKDLQKQIQLTEDREERDTEIDQAHKISSAILKFSSQKSWDKEPRLTARYGTGTKGNGLVIFVDNESPLKVKRGWNVVEVGIWENRKFGLARHCLNRQMIEEAVEDLKAQFEDLNQQVQADDQPNVEEETDDKNFNAEDYNPPPEVLVREQMYSQNR